MNLRYTATANTP